MALLENESIIVGGWFGDDGVSDPGDGVMTDGWFTYSGLTLDELIAILRRDKAIFVNPDGNYEEQRVQITP